MPIILLAVIAMLGQQTMATVAKTVVPVLFKPIADELGIPAELVLVYTWAFACVGIGVMLGCGPFISRFGALRTTQIGCVLMAVGLAALTLIESPVGLAICVLAFVVATISIGSTASTPASSQILARYSPQRWAPLVFSIKQAGVPAGVAIASFAAPILTEWYGWRGAALALAAASLFIALVLQPCRKQFDAERKPGHPLRFASLRETFFEVLKRSGFRTLAGAGFAFIGLQSIYTNFTVVYLAEELNYSLAEAGAAMGLATLVAAPGRVVWGWVASVWVAPRTVLIGLASALAAGGVSMGFYDPNWSSVAVMVPMFVVSATALSWHGILLSEVARLADGQDVARLTGGVLAFGTAGQIVFPLIFAIGYALGSYTGAFCAVAAPALWVAFALARVPDSVDVRSSS